MITSNGHCEGWLQYPIHFVKCMEQNAFDTVRRNPSIILGVRVTCSRPSLCLLPRNDSYLFKQLHNTVFFERKPGTDQLRIITTKEDHRLSFVMRHKRDATAFQLSSKFYANTETRV
ncbi:hypothetical protein TNCV_2463081 [Trichonephila clavipes]|nr:hypothetical protein TNCV_2463081 [Trichonephila clavipes]